MNTNTNDVNSMNSMRPPESATADSSCGGMSGKTLDQAAIGDALTVQQVEAPHAAPEWARWLEEIGFCVGERVMLMARALPGGDPLVVRVGQSTFALRRAEAQCIRVAAHEVCTQPKAGVLAGEFLGAGATV